MQKASVPVREPLVIGVLISTACSRPPSPSVVAMKVWTAPSGRKGIRRSRSQIDGGTQTISSRISASPTRSAVSGREKNTSAPASAPSVAPRLNIRQMR